MPKASRSNGSFPAPKHPQPNDEAVQDAAKGCIHCSILTCIQCDRDTTDFQAYMANIDPPPSRPVKADPKMSHIHVAHLDPYQRHTLPCWIIIHCVRNTDLADVRPMFEMLKGGRFDWQPSADIPATN
ncbi:hypothetical protein BCR37DRAFT_236694 [Protomyces lactucae-debilis]|uniref:Uncharacterized protein n=1 Tax=Protomyces lactucae-debilis TaxID=2754530 RepID=A0A1Y2EPW0_PROLT|nr:uncharacterized protein BCR37DRAFT_236694 [Protomyces lactucae-debilis]ORY73206.1 hypothetical protein BCR37DRAFT_236694 [Protomyces lactucae-debilis]